MYFSKIIRLVCGLAALSVLSGPAASQTPRKQCSDKYQAAKAAGTLNGVAWPQFLSQCLEETKAEPEAMPAASSPAPMPAPASAQKAPIPNMSATPIVNTPPAGTMPSPGAMPMGQAVFPKAVNPAYANEKPGTARMKTCVDQYKANKAANANGGMKWIQKGGGYYSDCNKHLKG